VNDLVRESGRASCLRCDLPVAQTLGAQSEDGLAHVLARVTICGWALVLYLD
jgi:hypothetical protein